MPRADGSRPKVDMSIPVIFKALLIALLIDSAAGSGINPVAVADKVTIDPARTASEAGLVDIRELAPDVLPDIRYAGDRNFVGQPIQGYLAAKCLLLPPVAQALARVQQDLEQRGYGLKVYDCYRPIRAVRQFVDWAHDPADQRRKAQHYPSLEKSALLGEYIAETSGHSRGATVDLTLMQCTGGTCRPLDMGTEFDLFDPRANTDSAEATPMQRAHRHLLRNAMERRGFQNYPLEWWHYTLQPEPSPNRAFDVPVD